MFLTSSWLIDIILLFMTSIFLLHKYISRNYDYWKKKGVFNIKPAPFFGNLYDVITLKTTMAHWQQKVYNSTDEPYVGVFVFHKPVLTIRSPQLIKQILVKDFNHFVDRTILAPEHNQVLAHTLFAGKSDSWKVMRPKVTPAFTSGKLKAMFPIVKNIGSEMSEYLKNNQGELESKELASKFATEVIVRTAFGINAHCFENEDSELRKVGRTFFEFTLKNAIRQSTYFFMQGLASFFQLEFADKKAIDYFKNVFWQTIEKREKSNIKGNDLIDLVIELRQNKEFCEKNNFVGDKVVAQPMQFFGAGVETTGQTISFALYELCLHSEIQNKAREEILNYLKENPEISYDTIKDLKYLEMCILETMRKYPVLPFLDRQCNSDYNIPGTDIVIDKGTAIYIPLLGLHYDEKYFPEPNKYNPERFADRSIYNQNGLYYLPFGEGPRICIGERFAMMNIKVALINILSQFVVEPTPSTPVPVKFTTRSFVLQSEVGLPIRYVEYKPKNYKKTLLPI